jgi:ketosteroid isomerase-like protein
VHPNAALLTRFYEAVARKDAEAMIACYHETAMFSDPAFPRLKYEELCGMWRMLMGRAKDFQVDFKVLDCDDHSGQATWEPRYTFGKTGRPVHNVIRSQFGFLDGKILAQRDGFDLWRWSRQALGFKGLLLGWSPVMKQGIQAEARKSLDAFMNSNSTSQS